MRARAGTVKPQEHQHRHRGHDSPPHGDVRSNCAPLADAESEGRSESSFFGRAGPPPPPPWGDGRLRRAALRGRGAAQAHAHVPVAARTRRFSGGARPPCRRRFGGRLLRGLRAGGRAGGARGPEPARRPRARAGVCGQGLGGGCARRSPAGGQVVLLSRVGARPRSAALPIVATVARWSTATAHGRAQRQDAVAVHLQSALARASRAHVPIGLARRLAPRLAHAIAAGDANRAAGRSLVGARSAADACARGAGHGGTGPRG